MMRISSSIFLISMMLSGCASVELHMVENSIKKPPKTVVIRPFEMRSLSFNPHISKNFRDSFAFEFFKRGYTVCHTNDTSSLEKNGEKPAAGEIKADCGDAHLIIHGMISEITYGDSLKDKRSVLILVSLYNKDMKLIGEGRYITSRSISNARVIKKIARTLARKIHKAVSKVP